MTASISVKTYFQQELETTADKKYDWISQKDLPSQDVDVIAVYITITSW